MMLNKKSSCMSAWKALYIVPLVGLSLAATAETKVDYRYEGQQPETVADTHVSKDSKNSFRAKNLKEAHFIVNEDAGSVTMVYYDLEGKELKSSIIGLPLGGDLYFINGNMATPKAFDVMLEDDKDAVIISTYLKNGKTIKGVVSAFHDFTSGTWDTSKRPDEQDITVTNKQNWHKVSSGTPATGSFREKNLNDGKIIADFENSTLTVIFYNTEGDECRSQFQGISLNENIYIYNGAYVNKNIFEKAAADDPEAVVMTSYLKDGNKAMVVVTPSEFYVTGTVEITEEQ